MLFGEKTNQNNLKGFVVTLALLFTMLAVYFMANYGNFSVYKFNLNHELFKSGDGIAYFTPDKRGIYLYNIQYLGTEEIMIRNVEISLLFKDNDAYKTLSTNSLDMGQDMIDINEYFKTFNIYFEETKKDKLTKDVEIYFGRNIYVLITYTDIYGTTKQYEIKINATKSSNNLLFY